MADAMRPFYTSEDLIDAIKRKISIPLSQDTFDEDDILRFVNEEMYLSQVPSVLMFHEEYFVFQVDVGLEADTSRYVIPDRAIGSKMRDLMYVDSSGNTFEMTRINPDDKSAFQNSANSINSLHKYYIEGNEVVLVPNIIGTPTGSLRFFIYLRPNQLVQSTRSATATAISETSAITKKHLLSNSTYIQTGTDTITSIGHGFPNGARLTFSSTGTLPAGINSGTIYYVVNTTTNTFQISTSLGGSAINITDVGSGLHTVTRTKILTTIFDPEDIDFSTDTITVANHDFANGDRVLLYNSSTMPTPLIENKFYYVVGVTTNTFQLSTSSGGTAVDITFCGEGSTTITSDITVITFSNLPTNITNSTYIDFLQTKSGHRTYSYDVLLASNAVSGSTLSLNAEDVPESFIVGDYICSASECIIPQIPSDLHNGLAERAAARILASIGDIEGLQTVNNKIDEINKNQSSILDNRAESSQLKVTARHSLLRFSRRRN
jgi:hypothetical protein